MPGKRWTNEELEYLIKNFKKEKYEDIARHLGRSIGAVSLQLNRCELKKTREWTTSDIAALKESMTQGESSITIAKKLKRSTASIMCMKQRIGMSFLSERRKAKQKILSCQ